MTKRLLLDLYCGAGGCAMGYARAGFEVVGVDIVFQKRYPFRFIQADALEYLAECGGCYDAIHASPPCQAHTRLRNLPHSRPAEDLIPQTRELLAASGKPYIIENVPGAPLIAPVLLCGSMFGLRTDCGAELRRHRLFETNWEVGLLPQCAHGVYRSVIGVYGNKPRDRRTISVAGSNPWSGKIPDARTIGISGTGQAMTGAARVISVHGHSGGHSRRDGEHVISVTGSTPQQNVVRNKVRECFPVSAARTAMGIPWMTMRELSQSVPPIYCEFLGARLLDWRNREA